MWLWRLINFLLFWSDDCRSWPRQEKINNHGCWGKHAHIPDNDYWGICLFPSCEPIFWGQLFLCGTHGRSKADFKSKSQNILQQIILFPSTVMQMICAWHKIWTLSGRLSLITKLFMHVSSRNMFPTIRNLQIRVHVYRPRHYWGS
jgi:hypothetical protein